jgi:anaerobic magnesium-protoporphyrin IX monomethyl ester cyclase
MGHCTTLKNRNRVKGNKVLLFNPWSAKYGYRIPNSILQVAASIDGKLEYVFVDGNRENNPWQVIEHHLSSGAFKYFGSTVMPGPQLKQAIPFTKKIKEQFPGIITIWGGYFPSNQFKTCIESGFVDYIIDGPGDNAFPRLLHCLENNQALDQVPNLIYSKSGQILKTPKEQIPDQDSLPPLPYTKLHEQYPLKGYLKKTFLGSRTAAYHSSFGCPFTCSFCAVVPIYNARWKAKSAVNVYKDIKYLIDVHSANAVEFHDNNFFVSEKRTVEFSELIIKEKIQWWGEGRIDTINKYRDSSLALMKEAGCKMIFFGAETSNDSILKQMDKGGTQTAQQIIDFAKRIKKFGIIPEYSFVLGMPGESEEKVNEQIDNDIQFIKHIKRVNPETEIIIYIYSPVPTEGSELYEAVKKAGFQFPQSLEDWLNPEWENFDLRRNPLTPWLKPYMVDKIQGFETVLNSYYPTISDYKLSALQRKIMKALSSLRYKINFFNYPYELKALQKFWLQYKRPETEGFFMEQ